MKKISKSLLYLLVFGLLASGAFMTNGCGDDCLKCTCEFSGTETTEEACEDAEKEDLQDAVDVIEAAGGSCDCN